MAEDAAVNPYRQFACELVRRERVGASFVRITLGGTELGFVSDVLGDQRVKLVLGDPGALAQLQDAGDWFSAWRAMPDELRPVCRTYTLSGVRPGAGTYGEVDIDVVVHDSTHGPASDFAAHAPLGTAVGLLAADRTRPGYAATGIGWHPRQATQVVLVGDETALPAITNVLAALPQHVRGEAYVEVPLDDDVRELARPAGVKLHWYVREHAHSALDALPRMACPPLALVDAANADAEPLWQEGEGDDWYLWAAGESGWVRHIRAIAKASGRPVREMSLMGYWKLGSVVG